MGCWCASKPLRGHRMKFAPLHPPPSSCVSDHQPRPVHCQSAHQSLWPRLKTPLCTQPADSGSSRAAACQGPGGRRVEDRGVLGQTPLRTSSGRQAARPKTEPKQRHVTVLPRRRKH